MNLILLKQTALHLQYSATYIYVAALQCSLCSDSENAANCSKIQ